MILCLFLITTGIARAADTLRSPGKTVEARTVTLIIVRINLDTHSVVLKDENRKSYECFVDPNEIDISKLHTGQTVEMSYDEYMALCGGSMLRAVKFRAGAELQKNFPK